MEVIRDAGAFLEDAAHYPGGHAEGVVFPRTPEDVARALTGARTMLPIGAQSSLTGGATPMGELILATSKIARILEDRGSRITVQAGVTVAAMQERLAARHAWFPPAPTFTGACAGGIVATNASGAATFKYGSTRDWVESMTVVLANGTLLKLERGAQRARGRRAQLRTSAGVVSLTLPSYQMPDVAKRSAGYHAADDMDLIDLFIGSEGTLGVIADVTFRVLSRAPAVALALIRCTSERLALDVTRAIRDASRATWESGDSAGIDACAIENMDARSVAILREDGADVQNHVAFTSGHRTALLVQLELPRDLSHDEAYRQIEGALTTDAPDAPLTRFCRLLDEHGVLDATELALPGDLRRAEQLLAMREAVPAGVNRRVGEAKRIVDGRIEKTAADMVVPFERFDEMMDAYRRGFERRGLDYAIWGHISDGNVHPNVIPRSYADVAAGREAILEFGREVVRLGGCPLAEHGVGRNPVKQQLLRQLYGDGGIEEMRAVKRALDSHGKLAPGVIFAP